MFLKKFLTLFFSCMTLFSLHCQGSLLSYPLRFAAECLYMLPSVDGDFYAVKGSNALILRGAEEFVNDPRWTCGFRLEAAMELHNCSELLLRWTQFNFAFSEDTGNRSIQRVANLVTVVSGDGQPNTTAQIDDHYNFYYLELLLGNHLLRTGPLDMHFQFGLHYGSLRRKETLAFITTGIGRTLAKIHSTLFGIGPELSTDFAYHLPHCFSLTGRAFGALLASKHESSNNSVQSPTNAILLGLDNEDYWGLIPVFNLRLGIQYQPNSRVFRGFVIETGYETILYCNAVNRFINFTSTGSGVAGSSSIPQNFLENFSLHGPYVRASYAF